ncbi:MAG: N-acetylglucosamine-6-phosphate deacetylase [Anaerocolumna sp.]|jgi:N-acetylglucosamine-6-phosphate deacetylase|nr:N-acetylglucosamine-6-phosphate deacetylase [Anaerocolumna sp.]
MIIKSANIYCDDGTFHVGDIYIENDSIKEVIISDNLHSVLEEKENVVNMESELELEKKENEVRMESENDVDKVTHKKTEIDFINQDEDHIIDGSELYAIPGLTDLHFHGCVGYDFCDGNQEAISTMARYQLQNGITTICPATMTLPEETLQKICETAAAYDSEKGAILCGINMEGPYVSVKKKGAQNEKYIRKPDIRMYRDLQKRSGNLIKLVAIAPEEEGAMEFIEELNDEVIISIAHTTANYDIAFEALEKGAKQVTHLYNAMPPFSHREPGVIGAACDKDDCMVELICDGIHIHPSVVRTTFKMFGEDRIILISDSMMATGLVDGEYELGGQKVNVVGRKATLVSDGAIAGSATNLMDCVRYVVKNMGISLETAIKCAAVNSAKAIGIYGKYGSITPGKVANIVLLDKELNINDIIFKGKEYKDK